MDVPETAPTPPAGRPGGAVFVALGILSSRLFGLVRQKAFAFFFGAGPFTDALQNALKAPNALQNLLGEQALSASFIPIYSRLLEEGREEDARRFAGAIFGLLALAVTVLVVFGVLLARPIVGVLSAGFLADAAKVAAGEMDVDRFELTVRAVRIVFPMTGLLVLSAWALGILNSHRRFLLPYMAPVLWNLAILGTLFGVALQSGLFAEHGLAAPSLADPATRERWLFAICWGGLLGGALQFLVQLPLVLRLLGGLRPSLSLAVPGVREALKMLGPAIAGRGVVQISLYLDLFLANWLAAGATSSLGFAILLVNLPLGIFAMSVAAAELPELSRAAPDEAAGKIQERVGRALRQSAFVIAPSVVGYLVFGFLVVGLLYVGGDFGVEDTWLVYAILAGYAFGLLASTISRLLQNAFFALRDTRTPARIAAVRVASSAVLGIALMLQLDRIAVAQVVPLPEGSGGDGLRFGAVGLALAASVAAWAELLLLRSALRRRVPDLHLPWRRILARLLAATVAALPALGVWWLLRGGSIPLVALVVLSLYAATYLGWAWWRRWPDWELWLGRLVHRAKR